MKSEYLIFEHEAMKTTFVLRIPLVYADLPLASISMECFDRLEQLEAQLSRYALGSEIQQINHMQAGDRLYLSQDSYQCIRIANQVQLDSKGAFDITLGKLIEHHKQALTSPQPNLSGHWIIDPQFPQIECIQVGREMDLGGIGKGYALDEIKKILNGWEIQEAVISAGASTQIAMGEQFVDFELLGDQTSKRIALKQMALSSSGVGIQAAHIVSPNELSTRTSFKRVWCVAQSASLADAWSTAAMLMPASQVIHSLHAQEELQAFVLEDFEGQMEHWSKDEKAQVLRN